MTLKDWAILARDSYTAQPSLGQENSAGRVVFVQSEQGLIIAIPGTNNPECVLADIDCLIHDAGEIGMVHRGGWFAFDPIWPDVSKLDVYAFVAHSEGCWGAFFLAARLCLIGKPPKVIYAFESPRVSIDAKLAEIFEHYKVELHLPDHGNDAVTMVPVELPFFPWQHPYQLEPFGTASSRFPNIEDHLMTGIIDDCN